MCNVESSVKIIWQLVSQFVSWDFCRYTSENSETLASEVDVLTFLRNMIVERTGKSMCDVTKHEIVAKFVMESKSVRDLSRLPCISALSESVKRICPELDEAVFKLMDHLENFLNVLDWNKDPQNREVVESRLEDAVNDFCKEANQVLPVPDLLKLLEPVIHREHHHKKPREKKTAFNKSLFEKVLECLHKESITASEAKIIAVSLYEDKFLEKIILGGDSETDTEADSEQFSLSIQSSQPLLSEEICQSSQLQKVIGNLSQTGHVSAESLHLPPPSPDSPEQEEHIELQPATFAETVPATHLPAVTSLVHLSSSDSSNRNLNQSLHINIRTNPVNNEQYLQSDGNESDNEDLELSLETRLKQKFYLCSRPERNDSDPDTSDCDKEGGFRFLTPTLFREDDPGQQQKRTKTVWLSDNESNDSSVITTVCDSQKNDPNWKSFMRFAMPSPVKPAKKRRISKPFNASQARNRQSDSNSDKSAGSSLYSRIQSGISSKVASKQKLKSVQRKASRKVASGRTQRKFKCIQCSSTFQSQLTLNRHVFLKHPMLEDSDCDS